MNTSQYDFMTLLEYQKKLNICASSNSTEIILNGSIIHAVLIFTSMLEKAVSDGVTHLSMYCGKASLFRNSTREKVEKECLSLKPVSKPELLSEWSSFKPYQAFLNAFEKFKKNNGSLSIVIDNQDVDDFTGESFLVSFKDMLTSNKLSVKQMPFSLGLNHFAYIGNSYRSENSDLEKTALCCFNGEKQVEVYQETFNLLQGMSHEFNLSRIA